MIRMNLLRNRKDGALRLPIEPNGPSAFISGREVWLAGFFLILGGAILWFVLGRSQEPEAASAAAVRAAPALPVASAQASSPAPSTAALDRGQTPAGTPPVSPVPITQPASAAATPSAPNNHLPSGSSPSPPPGGSSSEPRALEPGASPRGGAALVLSEVRVQEEGGKLQIFAATDGQPEYSMFRIENPPRIVIDLPGVRHEIPRALREQKFSGSIVREVRVAQNQLDPPVVRLVVEVTSFPELQVLPRANGLLISVAGEGQ